MQAARPGALGGAGGALTSTLMAACRGSVYRTSRPASGERNATAPGAGDRISSPPARPTTNIATTESSDGLTRADDMSEYKYRDLCPMP